MAWRAKFNLQPVFVRPTRKKSFLHFQSVVKQKQKRRRRCGRALKWAAKPKTFTHWPFTEKEFADFYYIQLTLAQETVFQL